jgi:N-acyl-D-aspartate/D-glutamate deacylase
MGERALRRERATDADIATMRTIVSGALGAGALGFSTGRHDAHRMADGRDTPASLADTHELVGIAQSLREHGHRVLQVVSDYNLYNAGPEAFDAEFALIEAMARAAQSPLSLTLTQRPDDHGQWRQVMRRTAESTEQGVRMTVQVSPRAVGVLMGLNSSFHPFIAHPSFQPIAKLSADARLAALCDPVLKAKLLAEKAAPYAGKGNAASQFFENLLQNIETFSARIFPDRGVRNFEPAYDESLQAEARRRGVSAMEAVYDALLERDGNALLYWPVLSYEPGNLDYVREMLLHPQAIMGLGDAGAHVNNINDYTYSTFAMSFWPSQRTAGPGLPLEHIVRLMTGAPAHHLGLNDRGLIEIGRRADLNLIDPSRLGLEPIRVVRDLPAGEQRLLQGARGYIATFKNGTPILENDELTGAKPGRLLRAA